MSHTKNNKGEPHYTKGGEFQLPSGEDYVGDYHMHPEFGYPMVGKEHSKSRLHDQLTPVEEDETLLPPPSNPTRAYTQIEGIQTVRFSKIVLEGGELNNDLVVTFELNFNEDKEVNNRIFQQLRDVVSTELNKYFKIKIIQSTNKGKTKLIKSRVGKYANPCAIKNENGIRVVSRDIDVILKRSNVQFKHRDTSNPEHLSYFAFAYYDFNDHENGDLDLPERLKQVFGPIRFRKVIENYSIRGTSDTVIQDFRSIKRLTEVEIQPSLLEDDVLGIVDHVNLRLNDSLKLPNPSAYFSDFHITRDRRGNGRFFFSLNFRKLLLENAVFGKYFTDSPDLVLDEIVSKAKIRSMKIIRRRVTPTQGPNRQRIFDENESEKVIIEASDRGRKLKHRTRRATIQESSFTPQPAFEHIRHFVGSDTRVSRGSYGHYQYGVEMEVEDSTIDFFAEKFNSLLESKRELEEYINLFNDSSMWTSEKLRERLKAEYHRLVEPVIKKYIDIISIWLSKHLINHPDLKVQTGPAEQLLLMIINTTNPTVKDPRGILELLQLVDGLLKKMENVLGVVVTAAKPSSESNNVESTGKSAATNKSFKIKKYFSELFNGETPKEIGFDYLSMGGENINLDGLRKLSFAEFADRWLSEMNKYYSNVGTTVIFNRQSTLNTNVNSAPIHFAPSIINVGDEKLLLTGQGVDLWERGSNDLVAAKILDYKQRGDYSSSNLFSQEPALAQDVESLREQERNHYLTNVANAFGIMVESAETALDQYDEYASDEEIELLPFDSGLGPETTRVNENYAAFEDPHHFRLNPLEAPEYNSNDVLTQVTSDFLFGAKDNLENRGDTSRRNEKFNLDKLNPGTSKNIFSSRMNSENSAALIRKMPTQIASIVAASLNAGNVKYNWHNLPKDPLLDYKSVNSFIFNYLLLQGVEYLSGYRTKAGSDKVFIKHPIWKPLTIETLSSLSETTEQVLCRLRKFEDPNIPSIASGAGLDLPSYDDYFVILLGGAELFAVEPIEEPEISDAFDVTSDEPDTDAVAEIDSNGGVFDVSLA